MKQKDIKKGIKKANQKEQNRTKTDFLYQVGETIYYRGGLYDKYKNLPAIVISRSTEKKYYKQYVIEFEDGRRLKLKEAWIDNIYKSDKHKEAENEDN